MRFAVGQPSAERHEHSQGRILGQKSLLSAGSTDVIFLRPIERNVEGRDDADAEAVRGYCAAVRSALTDDGRAPLVASGLKLQGRLTQVAESLDRVAVKRGSRRS